jgi:hypothetical protein
MVAVVWAGEDAASHGLVIPLVIQTIRLDPSGSVWIDEPSNGSRPDRSGADQVDAEHQATDLAVGGSNPSRRANAQFSGYKQEKLGGLIWRCQSLSADSTSRTGWMRRWPHC